MVKSKPVFQEKLFSMSGKKCSKLKTGAVESKQVVEKSENDQLKQKKLRWQW